ncbi:PREDICTED: protein FAM166B-like [Dinoponera quadriceps]|uniref:Protein FAM166B-like n=1 Tax=Dinoponera quadriceps TaxID=609295 RepID=A0A6P3XJ85_DINQU|nr:PREDICTED: protein FAM166B-like [Dinoponera quadriceps]
MVFDPAYEEQKKQFFRQSYGAHLPGYTGHCPTLKFRVGKRFGASTEEIMKELLEKKILKTGPYRPNSGREVQLLSPRDKEIRKDWSNEPRLYKAPPYILGYTGYIPGFSSRYGLPFMRAVEAGAKEWHEAQMKLRARRDAMRAHAERTDPRNLLSRARADNVDIEIDHGHDEDRRTFDYHVSPERPPIVGYTGHIPGARGEVALSKRYAQAARKGLERLQREREERLRAKDMSTVQRVLDNAYLDETGHTRA